MVQVCCPVGVSEEIMAVFYLKKSLNLTPKMTKVPKFSVFAHDEVNVHCSPAKKVFFPTIANFIISAF